MCTPAKLVVDLTRKETFSMKWNSSPLKSFQCILIHSFLLKHFFGCFLVRCSYLSILSQHLKIQIAFWSSMSLFEQGAWHLFSVSMPFIMWNIWVGRSPQPHMRNSESFLLWTVEEELESLLVPCYCLKQPQIICVGTRLGLSTFLQGFQKD